MAAEFRGREVSTVLKWSRVRLYLSILTCEGLFATIRERIQVAAPGQDQQARPVGRIRIPEHAPRDPDFYDYCGAMHVHSTFSDGAGTVADVADAANHAGLDFLLLSDHATMEARTQGQDGWYGRTLMMVGTEVATDTGHLLALAVPDAFLPCSGNAIEDQERILALGGIGFIALPCDLKDHWRDFGAWRPGIGLEVFNLSAIARTKINLPALAIIWMRYKGKRPHRAFHLVAARPSAELKLWDSLISPAADGAACEPVVGIASVDAHAVMKFGGKSYPIPTYQEVFRTLRTHVLLDKPLLGTLPQEDQKAASIPDQARVHGAIRSGHCYMAYDNYADSTGFVFQARQDDRSANLLMGDSLEMDGDDSFVLSAKAPRSRSFIRLYRNGEVIASGRGGWLEHKVTEPGAYRVEVYLYRRRLGNICYGTKPWIFSNPIYLQPSRSESSSQAGAAKPSSRSRKPAI